MPGALQGLGPLPPPEGAYRYVLFNPFIVTVTTRSLRLAAATASLSFVALQVSHASHQDGIPGTTRRAVSSSVSEWTQMKHSSPSCHLAHQDVFSMQSCMTPLHPPCWHCWALLWGPHTAQGLCQGHTGSRACAFSTSGVC